LEAVTATRRPSSEKEVLDLERKRERVAGLRMELVPHQHPVRRAFGDQPGAPADEAVDRIPLADLVQRELVTLPVEVVDAVLDPVGEGDQHLTAPRAAHLVRAIPVQELATTRGVGAEAGAHLGDGSSLLAEDELDLLTGRSDQTRITSRPPPRGRCAGQA
jgi:hypothetical protein